MSVYLNLKTVVVQLGNGTQVKLFDNSGDYHLTLNPTGWGDGSTAPARVAVTQITIDVFMRSLAQMRSAVRNNNREVS